MKKLLAPTAIIAMLFLTTACGQSSSQQSSDIELTFWTTTSEDETAFFQKRIDQFETEHPHVSVTMKQLPFLNATNEFKNAILGDQSIDVFRADNTLIPEYADLDIVYPLDSIAPSKDLERFMPSAITATTYLGHVFGLPSVLEVPALLYNKQMLMEAGFQHPPETMDEMLHMAKAVSTVGHYGIFVTEDSYFALPYLWAFGGGMVTDKRGIEIASAQSQQALAFMRKLWVEDVTQPYNDFQDWYGRMMNDFNEGRSAMMINGPWAIHDLLQGRAFTDPQNLGIAPIPKGPGGQGSPLGGHSLVINKYTKYPEESYALIRFLTSPETQVLQSQTFRTLPTQAAAYEDTRLATDAIFKGFKAQLRVAKNRPMIPEGAKLYRDFTSNLNAILLGKQPVSDGTQKIEAAWKLILK
ncbi:extracellular solute-binding protein family 1 [Paenibacillus curdlanolyticus YK9]|uniref:Extracellular solute-binding protein family 1 n=1 Tax=Paenibacillus curdlanolyticus YK9 TaxID=717606 RepID=E0IDA4_9BACL|nr:extracellular solute-binding protein [Paenibacillus curdlanolyticus]EFM09559.1 extracellular solute-binding protein family 1 [Paenibacillus curdlanolyticus YK9]